MIGHWPSFTFGAVAGWLFAALVLALMALSDWFAARRSRQVDARTTPGLPPAVVEEDLAARLARRDAAAADRLIAESRMPLRRDVWD
jgi:hypothetical protein